MKEKRTSLTSPLQIAEVLVPPNNGAIGMTICPGKKDTGRDWDRDLRTDLQAIRNWGATTVVTLIEDHEFRMLAVEAMESEVLGLGMVWLHLPILDVSVPDTQFELKWKTSGPAIHARLDAGERLLIHCRGGLGRTGLVAGRILVERGLKPEEAIRQIRLVRRHAIETREQEAYVLSAGARGTLHPINT